MMWWTLATATGCSTTRLGCANTARTGCGDCVTAARVRFDRGGDAAAGRYLGESAARGMDGRADIGFRKLMTGESVVTFGAKLAWRTSRSSRMSWALSPWDITELPPGDSMDEAGELEPVRSRVEPGELSEGGPPSLSAAKSAAQVLGTQISRGGCASGTVCRCFSSLRWPHISASILRNSTGTSAVAPAGCVGHAHADGGSVVACASTSAPAVPSPSISASERSMLKSLSNNSWLFCRADSVIVRGESGVSNVSLSRQALSLLCFRVLHGDAGDWQATDAAGAETRAARLGVGNGELRRGER